MPTDCCEPLLLCLERIVFWGDFGDEVATDYWDMLENVLLYARNAVEEEKGDSTCRDGEASHDRESLGYVSLLSAGMCVIFGADQARSRSWFG